MKLLSILLAATALTAFSSPAFASEPVIVHLGDDNSENVSGKYTHAYDTAHTDFYVVQGASWGINDLQTNLATITGYNPDYVTIAIGSYDVSSYASAQAWVDDLYSLFASIRAARPTVKIAVMTLPPRTGDATYTSRRQTINDTLRADESNGTGADNVIDFAANPTMSATTSNADTNLYVNEASIIKFATCPAECTTSGTKGHAYFYKQYDYAAQALLAHQRPWTVYPQTVAYSATPVVPSTDPPAYTLAQPAYIATTVSTSGWLLAAGTYNAIPPGDTPKFRTIINGTITGRFDIIRGPSDPEYGHCHSYFGNSTINYLSTYTTLRNGQTNSSSAGGGPINLTGYWFPCLTKANAMGDGIKRVKKPDYTIVYYVAENGAPGQFHAGKFWDLPRGLNYILGVNMDDPDNTAWKAELNGNVSWISNGWKGWKCDPSTGVQRLYLANTDGSDALNNCPATSQFYAEAVAPDCWDGVNLRSPTGYNHMRPTVRDSSSGQTQCPDNWYRLPRLEVKVYFSSQGPSDYINYRLDSDDMATFAGHATRNGESFHTDWFGAWDYSFMKTWMHNCTGSKSTSTDSFTPHECDYSTISATQRLLTDTTAPDGTRNPQIALGLRYEGDLIGDWNDYPIKTPPDPPLPLPHGGITRMRTRHGGMFYDSDIFPPSVVE